MRGGRLPPLPAAVPAWVLVHLSYHSNRQAVRQPNERMFNCYDPPTRAHLIREVLLGRTAIDGSARDVLWYCRLSPRNSFRLTLVVAARGRVRSCPGWGADWTDGRPSGVRSWRTACGLRGGTAPPPLSRPAAHCSPHLSLWPARPSSFAPPPSSLRKLRLRTLSSFSRSSGTPVLLSPRVGVLFHFFPCLFFRNPTK